ncbi:MAG: ribonuclease J [Rhodospirillales bacterium]
MTEPAGAESLVFVPLGGAGEIGMNLNLYGYGEAGCRRWLMIDLGIGFARGELPGTDVLMPDPTFIEERRDRLDGLLLTHAHEDHLGAVAYLWPRLRCPVFATRFTLAVLRRKLAEQPFAGEVPLVEVPSGGRVAVGPFALELVSLTHSIPDANGVIVRTAAGTLLHTGDWKFDPEPVVGPTSDLEALRRLGDEGVLAMICDSTNVFEPTASGAEGALRQPLTDLIGRCGGLVLVTCFATNVARLKTMAHVAATAGRDVVLVGASLRRVAAAAGECGYFDDVRPFLDESALADLPRERTLVICTGSQGEPRAALARIAGGGYPRCRLAAGDTVVFSSRVIPGNEAAIGRLHNALVRLGVKVVTRREGFVHVSGHPSRDELARMYALVRPRIVVPVHGELRHLREHADLALACGIPEAKVVENGDLLHLAPGPATVDGSVAVGRLSKEGYDLVPVDGDLVRERQRAIYNGVAVITVVLNGRRHAIDSPQLSTIGLAEDDDPRVRDRVGQEVSRAIDEMPERIYGDDDAVREVVRLAVRRAFGDLVGKKPLTRVHLVRI